jgi:hypothetical protein
MTGGCSYASTRQSTLDESLVSALSSSEIASTATTAQKHAADRTDQPLEVIMVLTRDEFNRLFERLAAQQEPTIRSMGVIWPGETGTF